MGLTGAVSSSVGHLRFRAGRLSNPEVCLTSLDKPEGLAGEPSVPRGQCSTVDEEAAMEPRDRRPGSGPLCVTPRRAARIWSSLCDPATGGPGPVLSVCPGGRRPGPGPLCVPGWQAAWALVVSHVGEDGGPSRRLCWGLRLAAAAQRS